MDYLLNIKEAPNYVTSNEVVLNLIINGLPSKLSDIIDKL